MSLARICAGSQHEISRPDTLLGLGSLGHRALEQRFAVLLEETHVDHGRLGIELHLLEVGQGLVHLYLEWHWIDLGDRVPGLNHHVVVDEEGDDRAAGLGGDGCDVSDHIGVVRGYLDS